MDEAKRRKELDPNFGKISFTPSKKNSLNNDRSNFDFLKSLIENMDNKDNYEYKSIPITVSFDYEVKCNLKDGQEISDSGHINCTRQDYFDIDESSPFALAYDIALHHFYRFEIEKKGLHEISNISITINNLESDYSEIH